MDIQNAAEERTRQKDIRKLMRKIEKQFSKCTYIGDIPISDEEYELLKLYLYNVCDTFLDSSDNYITSPVFAVALVQIGIRCYDSNFWYYVEREINHKQSKKIPLPGYAQRWIGRSFVKTLVEYNKYSVSEREMVNNILLHCFITEHYAADLFDFLLAFYVEDLKRDLTRNNKDMRNYLTQCMKKGENSKRAYKIKRHTSDAVCANERGCKIRVGRILKYMDKALFEGVYPTTSQNRIAQMFCKWASTAKKFDYEKKRVRGLTRKGEKRFSKPYLHFNGINETFNIVLPQQHVLLRPDEDIPKLTWRISYGNFSKSYDVDTSNRITGCETEKIDGIEISSTCIHEKITIELLKNEVDVVHNFYISASCIRFFDNEWDLINYDEHLPVGQAFAFVKNDSMLISEPDEAIFNCDKIVGLNLYSLDLSKGDILRLPDGKAISVGKILEEGLIRASLVTDTHVVNNSTEVSVYSSIPSLYFKMNQSQENGTRIIVNDKTYRFDIEKCIKCSDQDNSNEKGYILKLSDYITTDGIYRIIIDIPSSRKIHDYTFALINDFSFEFEDAPYIFVDRAIVKFGGTFGISPHEKNIKESSERCFDFEPSLDKTWVEFSYQLQNETLFLHIQVPTIWWSFDSITWQILKPSDFWHEDFPKTIYIKAPSIPIFLETDNSYMENEEDDCISLPFVNGKESEIVQCDTRKILSWFNHEQIYQDIFLSIDAVRYQFFRVIMKNKIEQFSVYDTTPKTIAISLKTATTRNSFVDILFDGKLLLEKVTVDKFPLHMNSNQRTGEYEVLLFEGSENDFSDEEYDYDQVDCCKYLYFNKNDLSKQDITITKIELLLNDQSCVASSLDFKTDYIIKSLSRVSDIDFPIYQGTLFSNDGVFFEQPVEIQFEDKTDLSHAFITIIDDDETIEFLYDSYLKRIVKDPEPWLTKSDTYRRFKHSIFQGDYVYCVDIKNTIPIDKEDLKKRNNEYLKKFNRTRTTTPLFKHNSPLRDQYSSSVSIYDLPLSKRALGSLKRANLLTADAIIQKGLKNLLKVRNLGSKCTQEVLRVLETHGYAQYITDEIKRMYGL